MIILVLFSMLAGFVTVVSPCILPVLPLLLSASVGQGKYRPLGIIVGLIISFSFFTLSLTALVHAIGISPDALRYVAMFFITFFGLTLLFPKLGQRFELMTSKIANIGTQVQEQSAYVGTGFVGGFVLGIALGLIWTPCAGPILATISTLVATRSVTLNAIIMTIAYSCGAAFPMFLIMYGGSKITSSTQLLSQYSEAIRRLFGLLMILSVLAMLFHFDVVLQQLTLNYFPSISVEKSEFVRNQLAKISSQSTMKNDRLHAPDFVGISAWINSDPLVVEQLRGKVVLVDFWTYSCINCIRTLPYIKKWYETYKDKGLVIVGVHTPEFEFEKNINNVKSAVKRFGITYPVAMDNDYKTWQNYNNHYWPAHYLIDKQGVIRHEHFGEGAYTETENAIRALLGLSPISEKEEYEATKELTPETYLGYERGFSYINSIKHNQVAQYDYTTPLKTNQIGLKGSWQVNAHSIQSKDDNATLEINFVANRVYLVAESGQPAHIKLELDGKPHSTVIVKEPMMYDLIDLKGNNGRHILRLHVPREAILYVFTFGSSTN